MLDRKLLEDRAIKKIIKEELGINENVRALSYEIVQDTIRNYDGSEKYAVSHNVFGAEYKFLFKFKDFPKLSMTPDSGNAQYMGVTYFDHKTVVIEGYTVRGRIIEEKLREVVQHELHHIFELYTSKKDGFFKDDASRSMYFTATQEVKNEENSRARRCIGYAIYLSNSFESRAFENGTYSYIMSQDLTFFGDELKAAKESGFYQRILLIRDAYDFVNDNVEESSKIAKDIYGKSYKWLKKTITYCLKECRRQFGRAVVKAGKDYDWTLGGKRLITI